MNDYVFVLIKFVNNMSNFAKILGNDFVLVRKAFNTVRII